MVGLNNEGEHDTDGGGGNEGGAGDEEALLPNNNTEGQLAGALIIDQDAQMTEEPPEWDDDRIVWDMREIDGINKQRIKAGLPKIDVVKKHSEAELGVRAHPDLGCGSSLCSIFLIHQNEFIFIWLYMGFAVYFWVQVGLLAAAEEGYELKNGENYIYMLVATTAVALSVTVTLIYLIFYCMSNTVEKVLNNLDWNFKLLAIYILTFVFIAAEMGLNPIRFGDTVTLGMILMYFTASLYVVLLVLVQYDSLKNTVWWITFGFLFLLYLTDLIVVATHQQVENFYLPMSILLALLAITGLFVFFHFPERFCVEHRIPQLFFTSHFWYAVVYLILLFFYQRCLLIMFKYNEQVEQDSLQQVATS